MEAEMRTMPERTVVYVQRKGMVGGTFSKAAGEAYGALTAYLNRHNLMQHMTSCIALYPDDTKSVSDEDCRIDAGVTLAEGIDYPIEGEVQTQVVPAGRFAVFVHKGPYDMLWQTWDAIYRDWVPDSGMPLRDAASYELYLNDPSTTPPEELLTEIHVPVE